MLALSVVSLPDLIRALSLGDEIVLRLKSLFTQHGPIVNLQVTDPSAVGFGGRMRGRSCSFFLSSVRWLAGSRAATRAISVDVRILHVASAHSRARPVFGFPWLLDGPRAISTAVLVLQRSKPRL